MYDRRMSRSYAIRLNLSPDQADRLRALQLLFSEACNFIAPMVIAHRCWNRVGLHHLAYKSTRQQYPLLGSQMVSNAIYSVSRACRFIYQSPQSRWFIGRNSQAQLPLLRFLPDNPVFFDRHTLSLKSGVLSIFTLDGRLRFKLQLPAELEERFIKDKLKEVALLLDAHGYALRFVFTQMHDSSNSQLDSDKPELKLVVEGNIICTSQAPHATKEAA